MEETQAVMEMVRSNQGEIQAHYVALAVKSTYLQAFLARSGSILPPQRQNTGLKIVGNVGVIDIKGALEKDGSFWAMLFGEGTYENIQEQLREALARTEITTVLLNIDSPGGTVAGIDETVALIRAVDKKKPVIAYGCGDVCSAAYALASAARKIVVSESTELGSIGVVGSHVDISAAEKMMGRKVVDVTAGEFKHILSSHAPLTDKGRAYLQAQVDRHLDIFKSWVQQGRGMTDEEANAVATGKVFIGSEGIDLKLIDSIGTYDEVLSSLIKTSETSPQTFLLPIGGPLEMTLEGPITLEMLTKHAPELLAQLQSEAAKSSVTPSAAAERSRIEKIMSFAPVGFEKEAQEFCFTAPITSADAAERFLLLAKERGASLLAAHRADAPAVVAPSVPDIDTTDSDDAVLLAASEAQNKLISRKYGLSEATK